MQRPSFLKRGGALLFYLLLFLFFAAPVLRLISMSLRIPGGWGLANFQVLFQDPRTLEAVRNTLFISLCSAGLSTFLGTALGFLMAYTDLRHKKLLELLILLPFIIPSYIITLSWSGLFLQDGRINLFLWGLGFAGVNLYTRGGILFVLGIVNMPVVYLSVIHFLRKIPVDLDLAARSCGFSSWETWRRIDLKEALPAIAAGGLLAFLAAMDNFAVPAFLGISSNITVLSTMIYEKAIGMGPGAFPAAAGLSVVLSCLALGGTLLESGLVSSQSALESIQESREPRIYFRPAVRIGVEGGLFLVLGLLDLVPLLDMMINAFLKNYGLPATADNFSWENFQFVFSSTGVMDALETSLLLASVAGAICLVAGTLIAYWKLRRHSLAALLAERGAAPGLCLAWHRPGPGGNLPLDGTPARHQTGDLRDHGAPSHRLRDPVHDPPNQREHQRPPGHQSGTGRRGAGLWERLADPLAPGAAAPSAAALCGQHCPDLHFRPYGTDPLLHAGQCRNPDHRPCHLQFPAGRGLQPGRRPFHPDHGTDPGRLWAHLAGGSA